MAFVPDAKQRTEEGAQKHGHRLEDLERAEKNARHARAAGFGRSRRWLWAALSVIVVVAVLFVIFQFVVPSDPVLLDQ